MPTIPKSVTLATLPERTAQEVFDWIVYNLRKQGDRSMQGNGCAYRGRDGLKCAAGWCIADDEYTPTLENWRWKELAFQNAKVPVEHACLIQGLQTVHDDVDAYDSWEDGFDTVASQFNLTYTPPENA